MKKKLLTLVALSCFLVAGMVFASPAAAWTGVTGQAFDAYGQGWTHGGDVYILNNATGDIEGTGSLDGTGAFNIAYGDDGLTCGCVDLDATLPPGGTSMSVFIIYNNGGVGTPGTGQADYTEAPIPTRFNIQVNTGTGPTAVTLSGINTEAGFNANYAIAALFLVLGGASAFALRRRSVQA